MEMFFLLLCFGFLYAKSLVRELRGKKRSLKTASVVQLRGMMCTGTQLLCFII